MGLPRRLGPRRWRPPESQHILMIWKEAGTSVFSANTFLSTQLPSSLEDSVP